MTTTEQGIRVSRCGHCATLYFPRRLICRKCGNASWREEILTSAVVEEATTVRHALGDEHAALRHLATVRADGGVRFIVGCKHPLAEGGSVDLYEAGGAPIARAPSTG